MRLKFAIWIGCLILSSISNSSAQAITGEGPTPGEDTTNGDDVTTTTTTTPKPLDAPVGSRRQYSFASGVPGMTMELDFEQQANNTLRMHCRIATTISAIDTLEKFCMQTTKPKLYLVYNYTNCNALNSLETVKAQEIAHTISPNDEVYKQVESFKWNDLEGNCFAMLQEKPTSRAAGGSEKIDTTIKGCDVLLTTTEPPTTAATIVEASDTQRLTAEDIIDEADFIVIDDNRIEARSGRMILTSFVSNQFTRTVNTITLSGFTILSAGSVYVAPTIVNAAPSPVVVQLGNFGGYTYNPWGTLPYLQLPGWSVSSVYTLVLGLFGLYTFSLLGSYIPGVSDFFTSISTALGGASATRKFSRFVHYTNDRLFDTLTSAVHGGINKYSSRNTYRPPHHTRRTDLNDDYYYEYEEDDQTYAENQNYYSN